MFNRDFFPTPIDVIEMMGVEPAGKVVLEPSAGKGDIVDWLYQQGAKEILMCELDLQLAEIIKHKPKTTYIAKNFLHVRPEHVSHIDIIMMNPPFSHGSEHILHAWEIAPPGCEIYSLVNTETVDNEFTRQRTKLVRTIEENGSVHHLGKCFAGSERHTNVEVSLVKLYKPITEGSKEFDGFFMDEEEETASGQGVMRYDVIRDVVQRYVNSVKCFEKHLLINEEMNGLTDLFDVGAFSFYIERDNVATTKEAFKKGIQKKAWMYIFGELNIKKYVTSGVMKDINKFVEKQCNVPFTMKNIYRMLEIIVGTREETFNRSLEEAIDRYTAHTKENRYNLEGWKTNAGHMLNKKFIINHTVEWSYGYLSQRISQYSDGMEDLVKVICSVCGMDYNDFPSLYTLCRDVQMQPNTWYDWKLNEKAYFKIWMEKQWKRLGEPGDFDEDFLPEYQENAWYLNEFKAEKIPCIFEVKGFLKGTLHVKFKDDNVWKAVNRKYGNIKGQVLPEKF